MGPKPPPELKNKRNAPISSTLLNLKILTLTSVIPITEIHIKTLFKFNKMHVHGTKFFFPPYLGERASASEIGIPVSLIPSQKASPL